MKNLIKYILRKRDREILIKYETTLLLGVDESCRRDFAEEHIDKYLKQK